MKLFQLWQQRIESYQPGDEYELVDAFARELRLERWYKWLEDRTTEEDITSSSPEGGREELLKERESAAVMYCLAALQEFEGMERQQILGIVTEIAMLGRSGLDYASSEKKYTLQALPGDFSGLQLMCFMYVGFQIIDPTVDTGMDLSEAYNEARVLYESAL
jgi:hypothetical protein